jgi:serine/threonine protein phosphatase PrpC
MTIEMMLRCPRCDAAVAPDDRFCEACGSALGSGGDRATARGSDHRTVADLGVVAGVSHRGNVHHRNEDALALEVDGELVVAVVCDGVSSSINPDVASRVAADTAAATLASRVDADLLARAARAVADAQHAVTFVPWPRDQRDGAPACTLAAASWDGERIVVANVGDTRVYWIGAGEARLLTEDDSWLQEQLDLGAERRVAELDRNAHAITRWLGVDAPEAPYRIRTFRPDGPGSVVVCSDGLWNYAPSPAELAHLVAACEDSDTPLALAHSLVDVALHGGGHDNVTVVVIDVDSPRDASSSRPSPHQESQ